MEIVSAETISLAELHQAMADAYSDYLRPMSISEDQLEEMLRQRGYASNLSFVAKDGDRIAAFWLTGVEPDARPGVAYAVTVGTRPSHRRLGLAQQLFAALKDKAHKAGIDTFLLEVIEENTKAVKLYEGLGYKIARRVAGFKGPAPREAVIPKGVIFKDVSIENAEEVASHMRDWQPTWQNAHTAMVNLHDDVTATVALLDGRRAAYGMLHRPYGQVAQMAVAPEHRREGIGRALLCHWSTAHANTSMTVLNVPDTDKSSHAFFTSLGWENHVNQFEMVAKL